MRHIIVFLVAFLCIYSCSKNVEYTSEFIEDTQGRYLFSADEVIEAFYDNGELFLKWRGAERMKPNVLDQHTFFVADMYQKLRFTQHPDTKIWYLAIVSPDDDTITYDYRKLADSVYTPSVYLEQGQYEKALRGYLQIQQDDAESRFIREYDFNRMGYRYLSRKSYEQAIEVFKINVALHPESSNVYDSLADAYARSGDSIQALQNYKKSLARDAYNERAKEFIALFENEASIE